MKNSPHTREPEFPEIDLEPTSPNPPLVDLAEIETKVLKGIQKPKATFNTTLLFLLGPFLW